jgi:hypothetical protein
MRRHRHQEFIRFLNAVERAVPAGRVIHDIVDNYANGSNVIRDGRSISHRHRLPGSMRSRASLQPTQSDVCIAQALNSGETACGAKIRS